jgi:drug/metabolite transporter (DMT)-like permease
MLFVILSSLLYGIEPSIRANALQAGATPIETMVVSSVMFFLLSWLLCVMKGYSVRIPRTHILQLLLIGGIGMGVTSLLLAMSYLYIPVGCATVIHFMYPTIVCLTMVLLFKERLTVLHLLAIVFSIAGLYLISGNSLSGSRSGILLALCSAFFYVFYIIMLDKGSAQREPLGVRLFYISLSCMLICGIAALFQQSKYEMEPRSIGILAFCGVLAFAAALLFAAGIERIGATKASFFSLLEPITSMVFSTLLYHYAFAATTLFGCLLSMAAILLISFGDRRKKRQDAARDLSSI